MPTKSEGTRLIVIVLVLSIAVSFLSGYIGGYVGCYNYHTKLLQADEFSESTTNETKKYDYIEV